MAKSPTAETKEVEEQETAAAGAPQVSPATQTPVGKPPLEITGEYKQWPQPYKFRKPLERPSAELQAKVAALNEATGLEWVAKSTAKGGPPCFTAVTKYTPQKAALLCRAFADTSLMPHEGNQWMNLRFWMQDETLVFILPLADNEKMTPEKLAQAARRYEACSFALEKHRIDSKNIICLDPQEPNPSSFRQIHSVLHPEEDRDEWWPQVLNQLLAPLNIPHQTVGD